jgi:hypothetical protein
MRKAPSPRETLPHPPASGAAAPARGKYAARYAAAPVRTPATRRSFFRVLWYTLTDWIYLRLHPEAKD